MRFNGSETPTVPTPAQYGIWYNILEAIIGFLAAFGNGFVVFLVVTRRNLQINPNYYILSLALADLLVGLILPTFSILCSYTIDCDWLAFYKFFNFFAEASVANLCLMTCDRYLAINFPLWYITKMTRKYLIVSIAIAWIFPAIFSMLPFFWMYDTDYEYVKKINNVYYLMSLLIFEVIPVLTMPIVYIRIFTVVRKHSRQVSKQREQVSYNRDARMVSQENGNNKTQRKTAFEVKIPQEILQENKDKSNRKAESRFQDNGDKNSKETCTATVEERTSTDMEKKQKKQKRHPSLLEREGSSSTLVLGLVILLFIQCWSYDIYITLCTRVHLCTVQNYNEEAIVNLLIYLNSTVNPLVYFLFKKDVRRELKACIRQWKS